MFSLNVINLFFLLHIISQLTVFISGKICDSEQIVTKSGIKLNLWTNSKYSIQNKATLLYLFGSGFSSTPKFDIWKRDLFYWFEATETFGVYYINSDKSNSISFNETSDGKYYGIYYTNTTTDKDCFFYSNEQDLSQAKCTYPIDDSIYNDPYYAWKFTLFIEYLNTTYDLSAVIKDFQIEKPLKDVLKEKIKRVSLLDQSTITNDSPGGLNEVVTNEVTKTESYTLSFSESITRTSTYVTYYYVWYEFGIQDDDEYFDFGEQAEFSYSRERSKTTTYGSEQTITKEVKYTISKTVNVLPYDSVKISSYVNWINNLKVKYNAKIYVTLSKKCGPFLPANKTKYILEMIGFNDKLKYETIDTLVFETSGYTIVSKGLDSDFTVTSLNRDRDHDRNRDRDHDRNRDCDHDKNENKGCKCSHNKKKRNVVYSS